MKFTSKYDYKPVKEQLSITEVVEREVNDPYREGAIERLETQIAKLTQLISMLLENSPTSVQIDVASVYGYFVANK